MKIILIGPQGSGKGTQAKILSKELEILHISTGDLFRGLEGELKAEVDAVINRGELVSDELTTRILKERLGGKDAQEGFILDGFPRNIKQVELLKEITNIDAVVEIMLSDEEAVRRISSRVSCKNCGSVFNKITNPPLADAVCDGCGGELFQRDDDTEGAVLKRLKVYREETEPVLNYYGNVIKVNGERSIEEIARDVRVELRE